MSLHRGLLAAFLLIGAALRVHGLGDHGLWIDEYGTWWALGDGVSECIRRVLAIHGQSPLYYLLVRASVALGGTDVVFFRLPSLLSGLGLLALAYPLALRTFQDRHTALLAVAAFALNDRLVYYSQEARPYGLALLCAGGCFLFYASALAGGGRRASWAWGATALATFYAHYLFGIVLAVQALHLLLLGRLRAWLGRLAIVGLLMVPGLVQFGWVFARRESIDWITSDSGALATAKMAIDLLDPVAVAALGALALVARMRRPEEAVFPGPGFPGVAALWFAVPLLAYAVAAPLFGISLLTGRYVAALVPAVPLLHALLMAVPRGPRSRWVPLAVFVVLTVVLRVDPLVQRSGGPFWWFHQHGWQAAVEDLVAHHREGDLILFRTGFVELDALVRRTASADTTGFVEWPVLAHLPPDRHFARLPLPYRDTPEMRALMAERLEEAAPFERVWVIGLDPEDTTGTRFGGLDRLVQHGRGLRGVEHRHYGVVHLLLYRPVGAGP